MTNLTRSEAARWLLERDRFCILTHRRPDGDTLGSAAGLCLALRSLGKQAHVLANPEVTPRFAWLLEGLTREAPAEGDTLVAVDVAAPGMLLEGLGNPAGRVALRIDHHGSATSFAAMELVDPAAGATAEIIWDLLTLMGVSMDAAMAGALYTGTSTDTGCFRFSNTTEHTFLVAAACAGAGAPIFRLNQELFETNSLARLRIQGWMVEHVRLLRGGTLALVAIPKALERELGATEDDMDNISGFPRTIAGVRMAATLRETPSGAKVSVRAVPGCDAAAVCAVFGGGGHKGAAGADISMPLAEAAAAVEKVMLEQAGQP